MKLDELGNLVEDPAQAQESSENGLTVGSIMGISFAVVITLIIILIAFGIVLQKCKHENNLAVIHPSYQERY